MVANRAVVIRLALDELVARLALPSTREELAGGHGVAAVVVDVPGGGHTLADADVADLATLGHLAGLPTVSVAVVAPDADTAVADRFDVVVPAAASSHGESLDRLLAGIERSPVAAVACAVLLRGSETRTIDDGLAAESAVYSLLQAGPEFGAWRATRTPRPLAEDAADPRPAVRVRWEGTGDSSPGEVLHLTLDRPEVHNAFSARMRDDLCAALELAATDPAVRVLLDGAGPSFSSGGDLREFGNFPDPARAHVVRLTRSAGRLVAGMADRVEVRLHGSCMGAGIEVPAFAGTVVADPATVIALPELRFGLVPGAGGTVSLPRRIGRQRTAYLALSGDRIDAATALEWGLVDRVTEPS